MFHTVARELAPCYCWRGAWCCGAARWRFTGGQCRRAGNGSAAAKPASRAGVAGVAGPCPGFAESRNRNRLSCVMVLWKGSVGLL
jgi:hypothetical protein